MKKKTENRLEQLSIEQIAVKITKKNIENVKRILDMFGCNYSASTFKVSEEYPILYLYWSSTFHKWHFDTLDSIIFRTFVKPRVLKQMLAKKKLKKGDYFIGNPGSINMICKFKKLSDDSLSFIVEYLFNTYKYKGSMIKFKRYATKEEIEEFEGKKEPKNAEIIKWYQHPKHPLLLCAKTLGDRYGFDTEGRWFSNIKSQISPECTKAPIEKVVNALIKEAKIRGFSYGSYVYDAEENELCGYNGILESVFSNGKWAEVIQVNKFSELKEAHPMYSSSAHEGQIMVATIKQVIEFLNNLNKTKMINQNFGQAVEAMKQGKRVARQGWNGKGMFIFIRPADKLKTSFIPNVKSLPQSVKDWIDKEVDDKVNPGEQGLQDVEFGAYICMKAADNSIINGWLASQTDILAEDWEILD